MILDFRFWMLDWKKGLLSVFLLLNTLGGFAQMDKADKLFADYKYAQAAELYRPLADAGNIKAVRKIAECYRKINDYDNAEKYYAIVVADKNVVPKAFLYYGQMLMNNEKYDQAKVWLQKFLSAKPDADTTIARTLLMSCDKSMAKITPTRKINIKNMTALNSEGSDFCAVPYGNGILFTSTRAGKINGMTGMGFQEVYYAKYNPDSSFVIEPVKGVVNTKNFNSGPACVDEDHQMIYFTKNNFQYGDAISNKKGDVTLKIFSAKKSGDGWKDIKELELNDNEYSCAFPSINANGDMLFFTSDRAGGYGGKDIYFSTYYGGTWSKPKNAGKSINTPGDERYPFIQYDGTLYFSSNGWPGYGGMDIFKCVPNKLGEFGKPENLGPPFNSATDDFGFYLDSDYSHGFFSSDRSGGKGSDDIYSFEYADIPIELNLMCDGKSTDSITVKVSKDEKIISEDIYNKKMGSALDPNTPYTFEVSKDGYQAEQVNIKTTSSKRPIVRTVNLLPKQ